MPVDELLDHIRSRRTLPAPAERRRIREGAGVSQRALAKALGVSWTAVHRWEAGSVPRTHLDEYADALKRLREFT